MEVNLGTIWPYILIFIAVLIFFSYKYEKKRTEALMLVAKKLGFTFSKSGRESTKLKHENFELFSKGRNRKLKNEIWGDENGNNISIFGYSYTTNTDNNIEDNSTNSTTHRQTVLSIESSELQSPNFVLKPEHTLHKIGKIFGYQDIDFELFPTFSKEYLLRGKDETEIRKFFSPQIIKYFELNKNIYMEIQENTLIFYQPSKRCKPDEIESFYKSGQAVLSNLL